MLVSVFGDPSRYAMRGLRAIQLLMEQAVGPYHWVCEGTATDLAASLAEASHKNIIFFADSPDRYISNVFLEGQAPLVALIHHPAAIIESLISERKFDTITAIRVMSLSLSCLHDLALCPAAYLITEPLDIKTIITHLTEVARIYRIPINDVIVKSTVDALMPQGRGTIYATPPMHAPSICVGGFESLLKNAPVDWMHWPREMFMNADEQGAPVNAPIGLTGPARLLLYGPFLHLPRGSWTAEVSFEVSENLSGNVMKVDTWIDEIAGEWQFKLPETGGYTFEIPLEILEPRHPVQIRFFLTQAAIEGIFDLKQVFLRRVR